MGKLCQGLPERNTSKNNKDSYRGRSQIQAKGNSSLIKKRKHSSKSKKRNRKRRYPFSSSSATSTTSDSNSSDNEPAIKRFKVVTEDKWYKYKISKSMASFANDHFELYLPDKELLSNMLTENPVPHNADQNKKLDDFAISIVKDRPRSANNGLINQDKVLEKVQGKIRDIMGPFFRLWNIVENATNFNEQSVNPSQDNIQKYIEQTVLMVGQSSDTVT